uniref:S-adenosylmethionine-dependent methyltransferase n=1 Tax=Melanopsichium pennsylvanicum 4 TaxID=1398559 RepID=A0A077R5L0_9BASI|nr:hypothetical protein BN887_03211 [Melanopsichium pennsylvanicum 4]
MSDELTFLPSRDLRDLRTLDLTSSTCLKHVQGNLESLARLLGASGGRIIHAPPTLQQSHQTADDGPLPSFEEPPKEVDPFERSYVARWLTRLISEFTLLCSNDEAIAAEAEQVSEKCAELLALSAGRMAAGASVQDHVFQLEDGALTVNLRDGPLVHDSLGTHTWGAAPILSQLLLPLYASDGRDLKVLELGAGTGLVGLSIANWSRLHRTEDRTRVVCTDYHPTVLENLAHNIAINGWISPVPDQAGAPPSQPTATTVSARCLDWQGVHRLASGQDPDLTQVLTSQTLPSHLGVFRKADWAQLLDIDLDAGSFDLLVAAGTDDPKLLIWPSDCVYDPVHPFWIKSVAGKLLRAVSSANGVEPLLHVMVPLRPTHQQEMQAVYQAFEPRRGPLHPQLVILSEQDYQGYENFGAWNSVVRSEGTAQSQPEGGLARTYRWFQIGWQMMPSA